MTKLLVAAILSVVVLATAYAVAATMAATQWIGWAYVGAVGAVVLGLAVGWRMEAWLDWLDERLHP